MAQYTKNVPVTLYKESTSGFKGKIKEQKYVLGLLTNTNLSKDYDKNRHAKSMDTIKKSWKKQYSRLVVNGLLPISPITYTRKVLKRPKLKQKTSCQGYERKYKK